MMTNYVARERAKDALAKQKAELASHREKLEAFQKAYGLLDDDAEPAIIDALHTSIVNETRKVTITEANIRSIERDLKTKYSVTPEYLAV